MFSLGDIVVYGASGVCKLSEIKSEANRQYYVLEPIFSTNSKIFVPTDNDMLVNRIVSTLSKQEVTSLLKSISEIPYTWEINDAKRLEIFKQTLISTNRSEILSMIKSLILHSAEMEKRKRHLHNADEQILKKARIALCTEFAYILGKELDEIYKLIDASI